MDPNKLTIDQLESVYEASSGNMNEITKLNVLSYVISIQDFSISSREAFAAAIASRDASLKVAIIALRFLAQSTDLKATELNSSNIEEWWEQHRQVIDGP